MASTILNRLKLATGTVSNVGDEWQTIHLPYWYKEMVVVATPCYDINKSGAVVQVRNANLRSKTFEIRVHNPKGDTSSGYMVNYVVMDAGVYNTNGIKIEALRFDSTTVDDSKSWRGQKLGLQSTFSDPVVLGQVMTDNDAWSVFWSKREGGEITIGRHIGEDPRFAFLRFFSSETMGIIVMEAGSGEINGIQFEAGNTPETVVGRTSLLHREGLDISPLTAVASPGSMNDKDGYWTAFWNSNINSSPFDNGLILLANEDQIGDDEQDHIAETVGYLALNSEKDAARFLEQAGFGSHFDDIRDVSAIGYAAWIDAQQEKPRSLTRAYMDELLAVSMELREQGIIYSSSLQAQYPFQLDTTAGNVANGINFSSIWMRNIVHQEDQLRQRVTFALSQIFVVSMDRPLGRVFADYYDVLSKYAFGNFRDLLQDISVHPLMAWYLTSLGNRKASADGSFQPDENYARELMQLFSIGLAELKQNGEPKLDGNGDLIPTYDIEDVIALARVFTGLWFKGRTFGAWEYEDYELPESERETITGITVEQVRRAQAVNLGFQLDERRLDMFEDYHDQEPKTLFRGKPWETTLPANNGGMNDIRDAVDVIFNHPNVPPFISRRLIQFLVTSNPSPNYIYRVARVFRNNGNGVRGDLHAVVKQILLDPEARYYRPYMEEYGKLTEPMIRLTKLVKAFRAGKNSPDLVFLGAGDFEDALGQWPLFSPTVFNFFSPDYQAGGILVDERKNNKKLFSPEFQILNSSTVISLPNTLRVMINSGFHSERPDVTPEFKADFTDEIAIAHDVDQLLDRLDILLTNGQMSEQTRTVIKQGVEQLPANSDGERLNRVRLAVWLVVVSPDGSITR